MSVKARNVLGGELADCSERPLTGFFRDGCCNTSDQDRGSHTVCVLTTAEFLAFSSARGNDLSTPVPEFEFPGLKPGDRWCLCAARWQEAFAAGKAPRVVLQATHERALDDCHVWRTRPSLTPRSRPLPPTNPLYQTNSPRGNYKGVDPDDSEPELYLHDASPPLKGGPETPHGTAYDTAPLLRPSTRPAGGSQAPCAGSAVRGARSHRCE